MLGTSTNGFVSYYSNDLPMLLEFVALVVCGGYTFALFDPSLPYQTILGRLDIHNMELSGKNSWPDGHV